MPYLEFNQKVIRRMKKALYLTSANQVFRKREVRNVVLYHAMTAYQFLECLADKLLYNKEKNGVFLISKYISSVYPNYYELVRKKYFQYILIYDIDEYSEAETIKECEDNITNYYDKLLSSVNVSLENCSEIHIAGAHHGFGSFICMKGKRFYFYEEAAGLISNSGLISGYEKSRYPIKHSIVERDGLFDGKNDLIIENRCVLDSQIPGYFDEKAKNYEVIDKLSKLKKEDMSFLLYFFNIPQNVPFKANNLIILGQQLFHEDKHLEENDSIQTYQLLIDYFSTNENIIFKPHPADMSKYESFLDDVFILREKFPSEFLPFLPGAKYQTAMTINSTAIRNLGEHVENVRILGYWFMDFRKIIHRCWAAIELVKLLENKETKYYHYGIHNDQIHNFIKFAMRREEILTEWLPINNIPENSISIIDNIKWAEKDLSERLWQSMSNMTSSSVLIFINQHNDYCFYNFFEPELLNNIVPFVISKEKVKNNIVEDLHEEVIYVFCKDKEKRKLMQQVQVERHLKRTGIRLRLKPVSDENLIIKHMEIKVSVLESKLRDLLLSKRV